MSLILFADSSMFNRVCIRSVWYRFLNTFWDSEATSCWVYLIFFGNVWIWESPSQKLKIYHTKTIFWNCEEILLISSESFWFKIQIPPLMAHIITQHKVRESIMGKRRKLARGLLFLHDNISDVAKATIVDCRFQQITLLIFQIRATSVPSWATF